MSQKEMLKAASSVVAIAASVVTAVTQDWTFGTYGIVTALYARQVAEGLSE